MNMTADDRAEWEAMLTEAWTKSSRASMVANELEAKLLDAEQADREWAREILEVALNAGLAKMAKEWHRKQAPTDRGPIALTAGVMQGGKFVQLDLLNCDREQLRTKLVERENHLKAASRNARFLRDLLGIYDQHPKAKTLRAALKRAGVTLEELLAA